MEEQPRSKWEELLEICITEQGLANLAALVGELEYNMGVMATTIGSKHTPGTLPSLPAINPQGKCHAVQLRSGTTYQPPQAADLGRGRKEREQEPTGDSPATDQIQRPAAHFHNGPPEASQPPEPGSDIDAEPSPAAAAPLRSCPLPEQQSPDSQFPSTVTYPESITFNIYDALKFHGKEGAEGYQECSVIQVVTDCVGEVEVTYHQTQDPLEYCLINSFTPTTDLSTCEDNVCAMIA
ncbi:hypothetical protein SASPL_118079 [Salvia splendens]|uniref:Uncharacterized protein n=1 Tax=Salvia splendens TaxID=180675 RepID=A0A8X8XWP6_SALSN|nr:hypothetical protein SASPL_118079 [Salvia splendens]